MLASVIVLNYNTATLTLQAIDSLAEHTKNFDAFEIIIVDNASNEPDFFILKRGLDKSGYKNLQLLRSEYNLGFGGGNMLGVEKATADFLLFMNSDVLLKEDSLNQMLKFMQSHPNIAAMGAQAMDEHGKRAKAFDYRLSLASELFSHSLLHNIAPKKFPDRKKKVKQPIIVGAVPGSFFLCKTTDFKTAGGFDKNIFLFYEEKDLCFRFEKMGREIYSYPSNYIHLKGKSTPQSFTIKQELKISQFQVVKKNLGLPKFLLFYAISSLIFLLKSPFSKKNRQYLKLALLGFGPKHSLKYKNQINLF